MQPNISILFLLCLLTLVSATQAQTTNTWSGTASSNWNTANNWSLNAVPTASHNVVIPSGTPNAPILSTAASASTVEVQSGASLSISSAGSLSVNGSKSVSGLTAGFYNRGTVVSGGSLVLGNTGSVGNNGLVNYGSFSNLAGGSIQIDNASNTGLYNDSGGRFVNASRVVIGSVASLGSYGLYNFGSFSNVTGGSIQIDRTSNTGLRNELGSFVNSSSIVIGSVATVGNNGLDNFGSFSNVAGGSIQIDNASSRGLNNSNGSFVNASRVVIGSVATVGNFGLDNAASFSNVAGGSITIDRASFYGLNNNGGSFVNASSVVIGSVAVGGQYGLGNGASFSNVAGGSITIDRTSNIGLYITGGRFVNQAIVTLGSSVSGTAITNQSSAALDNQGCAALMQSLGNGVISNAGSFSNTGTLIESSTGTSGISYNGGLVQNRNGGTFNITTNAGALVTDAGLYWRGCVSADWNTAGNWSLGRVPTAGDDVVIPPGPATMPVLSTTATANSVEVQSGASLSISSAGSLSINGSKSGFGGTTAFYNAGTVMNGGSLVLGNTGSVGNIGLYNVSSFSNTAGGLLTIDRVSSAVGLYNQSGSFVNSSTLLIGSQQDGGYYGLYNESSFSNVAGGLLTIDRVSNYGLRNQSGSFVNSSTLLIGSQQDGGYYGLLNVSSFRNTAGGYLTIDRVSTSGLYNGLGSFVNSSTLLIGSQSNGGTYGLWNFSSFSNTAGSLLTIDRVSTSGTGLYNGSGSFVNQAIVTLGASVSGTAIQNQSGATLDNQGCAALLQSLGNGIISNSSSFSNTGTLIESSTGNSGISYNGGLVQNRNGGTFNIGQGNPPLSLSAPLNGPPFLSITTQPAPASAVCVGGTVSVSVEAIGIGSLTYQWYKDGASLGAGQSTSVLSLLNLQTGNTGSYSVVVTDNCGTRTSTAFSLTVGTVQATLTASNTAPCSGVPLLTASGGANYAFTGPGGLSQTGAANSLTVSQSGNYSVVVTGANGCTASQSLALTLTPGVPPTVTLRVPSSVTVVPSGPDAALLLVPADTPLPLTIQATGGAFYERTVVLDRINGYEIRTSETNQTGIFILTQLGAFQLRVNNGTGCERVVQATVQAR